MNDGYKKVGAFLSGKAGKDGKSANLYRVILIRKSAIERKGTEPWNIDEKDRKTALVVSSSVEGATRKATGHFNQGGETYEVQNVSLEASRDSEKNTFIG